MARASIIVVNWNSEAYLGRCLQSVLAQIRPGDEVIVVDNASTDGSAALARERYPCIRLVENDRNLGFAGGCNAGLRVAQGNMLFMLNPDVVLREEWLNIMCEALANPTVGVAGCKLLYPDGQTVQHAGGIIRWPRAMPDHRGYHQADDGRWDEPMDVDYVTGAAWGIRRDTLERVGELDKDYWPGYYEEVDYCLQAREMGLRVLYVSQARAIHVESATLGLGSEAYLRAFHRGRLRFVLKHLPPEQFLDQFVPAEQAWLRGELARVERRAMGRTYRAALLMTPAVYAAHEERVGSAFDTLQAVTQALVHLQAEVWEHPACHSPERREEEPIE